MTKSKISRAFDKAYKSTKKFFKQVSKGNLTEVMALTETIGLGIVASVCPVAAFDATGLLLLGDSPNQGNIFGKNGFNNLVQSFNVEKALVDLNRFTTMSKEDQRNWVITCGIDTAVDVGVSLIAGAGGEALAPLVDSAIAATKIAAYDLAVEAFGEQMASAAATALSVSLGTVAESEVGSVSNTTTYQAVRFVSNWMSDAVQLSDSGIVTTMNDIIDNGFSETLTNYTKTLGESLAKDLKTAATRELGGIIDKSLGTLEYMLIEADEGQVPSMLLNCVNEGLTPEVKANAIKYGLQSLGVDPSVADTIAASSDKPFISFIPTMLRENVKDDWLRMPLELLLDEFEITLKMNPEERLDYDAAYLRLQNTTNQYLGKAAAHMIGQYKPMKSSPNVQAAIDWASRVVSLRNHDHNDGEHTIFQYAVGAMNVPAIIDSEVVQVPPTFSPSSTAQQTQQTHVLHQWHHERPPLMKKLHVPT